MISFSISDLIYDIFQVTFNRQFCFIIHEKDHAETYYQAIIRNRKLHLHYRIAARGNTIYKGLMVLKPTLIFAAT